MFTLSDVLIVPGEVVDMFPIDLPHHLQGLLATVDAFLGNIPHVAEVGADCPGHFVGDGLVGEHSNLFAQVDAHWLVSGNTPLDEFLHLRDRLKSVNCPGLVEELSPLKLQFLYEIRFKYPELGKGTETDIVFGQVFGGFTYVSVAHVLFELSKPNSTSKKRFLKV